MDTHDIGGQLTPVRFVAKSPLKAVSTPFIDPQTDAIPRHFLVSAAASWVWDEIGTDDRGQTAVGG
ncbi:hypothetical protein DL1_02145 [Thioclava dalianensis]|uniref:Uncharacterized protein n=1 Tax=Thioclava dalianensis TaxID=1185766 RepID=A0A074TDV7_9RHOB|nr:hypothetical protein DL1_02145 [Thioclava dalianensis]